MSAGFRRVITAPAARRPARSPCTAARVVDFSDYESEGEIDSHVLWMPASPGAPTMDYTTSSGRDAGHDSATTRSEDDATADRRIRLAEITTPRAHGPRRPARSDLKQRPSPKFWGLASVPTSALGKKRKVEAISAEPAPLMYTAIDLGDCTDDEGAESGADAEPVPSHPLAKTPASPHDFWTCGICAGENGDATSCAACYNCRPPP